MPAAAKRRYPSWPKTVLKPSPPLYLLIITGDGCFRSVSLFSFLSLMGLLIVKLAVIWQRLGNAERRQTGHVTVLHWFSMPCNKLTVSLTMFATWQPHFTSGQHCSRTLIICSPTLVSPFSCYVGQLQLGSFFIHCFSFHLISLLVNFTTSYFVSPVTLINFSFRSLGSHVPTFYISSHTDWSV